VRHAAAGLVLTLLCAPDATRAQEPPLAVRIVADEAEAVLSILDVVRAGRAVPDSAWRRLVATEGYRRLRQREAAMGRPFTDSAFQAFVRSPELATRTPALRATLDRWVATDPAESAQAALAYLPAGARIRATVYPVIKPRTNSFVFEPRTNPAIFLYLDPAVAAPKFANTLAHELHHLGYASACPDPPPDSTVSPGVRAARDWMGGFAEGRAVLAAAGGPDVHPHAVSDSAERAVWDRDVAFVPRDMERLTAFWFDLLDRGLSDEDARVRGFTFVSTDTVPQGAFYTVGWFSAATVERELGRARLVATTCDPPGFLADYNRAAARVTARGGPPLPRWSDSLLVRVGGAGR
jgi:hypothetical protein